MKHCVFLEMLACELEMTASRLEMIAHAILKCFRFRESVKTKTNKHRLWRSSLKDGAEDETLRVS